VDLASSSPRNSLLEGDLARSALELGSASEESEVAASTPEASSDTSIARPSTTRSVALTKFSLALFLAAESTHHAARGYFVERPPQHARRSRVDSRESAQADQRNFNFSRRSAHAAAAARAVRTPCRRPRSPRDPCTLEAPATASEANAANDRIGPCRVRRWSIKLCSTKFDNISLNSDMNRKFNINLINYFHIPTLMLLIFMLRFKLLVDLKKWIVKKVIV
jgi:hypothetical protein